MTVNDACTHTQVTHRHGTYSCYNRDGCRCIACTRAHAKMIETWRLRRLRGESMAPSIGVARRLQALAAEGWSFTEIAERLGTVKSNIIRLAAGKNPQTFYSTVQKVEAFYQRPGIPARRDVRNINRAKARGWAPPLAWDDDDGPHGIDNPDATPYDCAWDARQARRVAHLSDAAELLDAGESPEQIAERLGVLAALARQAYRHGNPIATTLARHEGRERQVS